MGTSYQPYGLGLGDRDQGVTLPLFPRAKVSLCYTRQASRPFVLPRLVVASSPETKILRSHAADLGYKRPSIALWPHRPRHLEPMLESNTRVPRSMPRLHQGVVIRRGHRNAFLCQTLDGTSRFECLGNQREALAIPIDVGAPRVAGSGQHPVPDNEALCDRQ